MNSITTQRELFGVGRILTEVCGSKLNRNYRTGQVPATIRATDKQRHRNIAA